MTCVLWFPRFRLELADLLGITRRAWKGGILCGAGLTAVGRLAVAAADIRFEPPGVAEQVQVEVDPVPAVLLVGAVVFVCLSVVSAAYPTRRASRLPIVDALGHV